MARINLLPWRDEVRKERNKLFGILMGVAALLAGGVVFAGHLYMVSLIEHQQARNEYLRQEISSLDKMIKEIASIEKKKAGLRARMNIIQELQSQRPLIVHLFDELVTTLPEGVVLKSITQQGDGIVIQGTAQSNERVSTYMRNLDASIWFATPTLQVIAGSGTTAGTNDFTLRVKQVTKQGEEEP